MRSGNKAACISPIGPFVRCVRNVSSSVSALHARLDRATVDGNCHRPEHGRQSKGPLARNDVDARTMMLPYGGDAERDCDQA